MIRRQYRKKARGYLIVVAMLLIVVIGFLGVSISSSFYSSASSASNYNQADKALYIAESGLEYATRMFTQNSTACTSLPTTNSFGEGQFSITSASLSGANCIVTVVGAIPSIASPQVQRSLTATIIAPVTAGDGLLGGAAQGSNLGFARWNNPTAGSWNTITFASTNIIYAIGLISSATDAWVVTDNTGFFGRWNGTTISASAIPNAVIHRGISCPSATLCYAVGDRLGSGGSQRPSIVQWSGGSWTSVLTAGGAFGGRNNLKSIHCPSTASCWAVGDFGTGSAADNLFYRFNGSWSSPSVNTICSHPPYNGVYCPSSTECWAVGADNTFCHWISSAWSQATYASAISSQYNSITCTSPSDCWAVGNAKTSAPASNTIAHWTGSTWTAVSDLGTSTLYNINSVSCTSSTDCWAVGSTTGGTRTIFRYTSGAWSVFTNVTGTLTGILNAVAMTSGGSGTSTSQPISAWKENF